MRRAAACLALIALSACATPNTLRQTDFVAPEGARIVIMKPDVSMSLLTAGGLAEPRADWTSQAEANIMAAVDELVRARGHQVVAFDPAIAPDRQNQLILLHEAVGASIITYVPSASAVASVAVPTKAEGFDWTLGAEAVELRDAYDADFALFVSSTGSYASGGRVAATMVTAVLFGGGATTGMLGGRMTRASLVDLRTGDIVWMNLGLDGDPREADGAEALVARVTADLPL